MSSINLTEDLRSIKTEKALFEAMFSLLECVNFKKITVKKICEESLISRAAFYSHFIDKYDLLQHWITDAWSKIVSKHNEDIIEHLKILFCPGANKNLKIIKNLIEDSDNETFDIIFDFLISTQNINLNKSCNQNNYNKNVVLSNFFAGGIIWYLRWQIKNMFPKDTPIINQHLCDIIEEFKNMHQNNNKNDGGKQ